MKKLLNANPSGQLNNNNSKDDNDAKTNIPFNTNNKTVSYFNTKREGETKLARRIRHHNNWPYSVLLFMIIIIMCMEINISHGLTLSTAAKPPPNNQPFYKPIDFNKHGIKFKNHVSNNSTLIRTRMIRNVHSSADDSNEDYISNDYVDDSSKAKVVDWSNAIFGALFGSMVFLAVFLIVISILASIRAIDYYIFGRKDIRKELLNGEDVHGGKGSIWTFFSWKKMETKRKSVQSQPNAKPQLWKAQMFHVVSPNQTN